jgi:tight adherence protein B
MLIIAGTFIGIVALVTGIYWLMFERAETREQQSLDKRLRAAVGPKAARRIAFIKDVEKLSAVKGLETILARTSGISGKLQQLLERADMRLTVGALLLASACLFMVSWLVVTWMTGLQWLGLAAGALLAFAPLQVVRFKATSRLRKFEEQFPDTIDLISRALRAGHGFTTGLSLVAEEAPQPIAGEFRLLYDQQNFGMPLADAMKAFAERLPLLDAKFFVTAVLTQRESGGNLSEILGNLANVIRERFKVKRPVRVISAHGRITGWVLSGLPPSLAATFMVTSPNHIMTLVRDPMGVNLILAALFLQVVGTLIIRKLVDIEY